MTEWPISPEELLDRAGAEVETGGQHLAVVRQPGSIVLRTVSELLQTPATPYLIKGLLHPNDLAVLFGEPGCGKSFLALDWAYKLSHGLPIFGRRVAATPVIYAALEGERGIAKRLRALVRRYGYAPELHFIVQPLPLAADTALVDDLIGAVRRTGARLVVIDTLARAMVGLDEMSAADMGKLIGLIDRIRASTDAAVMLVHHSGKDKSRGARGSSALRGAADLEIEVANEPDTKEKSWRVTKAKDEPSDALNHFAVVPTSLGNDSDGEPITTCVIEERECVAASAAGSRHRNRLTESERAWFHDLQAMMAEPGLAQSVSPRPGMDPVWALTRDQVRQGFRLRGRIGDRRPNALPNAPLSNADRTRMSNVLKALTEKGKIKVTDTWIWLS